MGFMHSDEAPCAESVQVSLSPVMQKPRSRIRRWFSPSAFLLSLLLFPLPWFEVQCDSARNRSAPGGSRPQVKSAVNETKEWFLHHLGLPSNRWTTYLSESGLEAALGTFSNRDPKNKGGEVNDSDLHFSIWMALLPFVLLLGVLFSIGACRSGRYRDLATLCALSALFLLVTQIIAGFPLQRALERDLLSNQQALERDRLTHLSKGVDPKTQEVMRYHYTCWFGLTVCALAGVVVLHSGEWLRVRKAARRGLLQSSGP